MIESRSNFEGMEYDREEFDREADAGSHTEGGAFRAWLQALAKQQGASHIGEKSPVHGRYVFELLAMFPEARAVHIIRDPRDVALSFEQSWGAPALQAAFRWRTAIAHHLRCSQLLDASRYAAVRYEALVNEPKKELLRLCEFLRIDFDPAMLKPEQREHRGFAADERHKKGTMEPVITSRVGRYKDHLSAARIALVERVCGEHMDALGYVREGGTPLSLALELPRQTLRLALSRGRYELQRRGGWEGWISRMPLDEREMRKSER